MSAIDKHRFPSVHKGIVRAALMALDAGFPDAARHFTPTDREILIEHAADPDLPGDRHQGRGLHYYNAVDPYGKPFARHPVMLGYCNGLHQPAPSPLSVLDSEYRTALALACAGRRAAAMDSLTRALHMLADTCCPPHTCSLTYFSRYARMHKRYEATAAELFWNSPDADACAKPWAMRAQGFVPYPAYTDLLRPAKLTSAGEYEAGKFAELCNALARTGGKELPAVIGEDETARIRSIEKRLTLSVAHCTALLAAFARDVHDKELPIWREQTPYWLSTVSGRQTVSRSPLYLHFQQDGTCILTAGSGESLAVTMLRTVRFLRSTENTLVSASAVTNFRFGMEPLLTLYPSGDQQTKVVCSFDSLRQKFSLTAVNRLTGSFSVPQTYAGLTLRTECPQQTEFLYAQ
ncbi:MAG TPA: hypothetical protein DDX71_06680 [Ruminococcus sp.]|nr:hypothetical protein [Ruminococcus sp.]